MRRFGEAIAIATTSVALMGVSGDTVQPSLEQMAPDARVAVAERYASCDVTNVELDQTTRKIRGDRNARNSLIVGVTVVKTADALMYEKIYAEDDTVMWDEPVGGGAYINLGAKENAETQYDLGLPVTEQGDFGAAMSGEKPTGSLRFAPRADYKAGTQMNVYVSNHTMTYDFDGGHKSEAVGYTYCGTLEASADDGRVTDWRNIGHLPELTSFVIARECDMQVDVQGSIAVTVDANDTCTDWQRVK